MTSPYFNVFAAALPDTDHHSRGRWVYFFRSVDKLLPGRCLTFHTDHTNYLHVLPNTSNSQYHASGCPSKVFWSLVLFSFKKAEVNACLTDPNACLSVTYPLNNFSRVNLIGNNFILFSPKVRHFHLVYHVGKLLNSGLKTAIAIDSKAMTLNWKFHCTEYVAISLVFPISLLIKYFGAVCVSVIQLFSLWFNWNSDQLYQRGFKSSLFHCT